MSVTGTLAAGFTGTLSNTGRVASPTADPDATNNASTVSGQRSPVRRHRRRQDDEPGQPGARVSR